METRPTIEFAGDFVRKRYRSNVDIEFKKAKALWKLSQHSDFVFPEPVDLRRAESIVVSRNLRVHGRFRSIHSAYLDYMTGAGGSEEALHIFQEAGRVLGVIHRELVLPHAEPWSPPEVLRRSLERGGIDTDRVQSLPTVCLHGDFGFSNVFCSETGSVATLDASPDGYSTFVTALVGPAYVDLGQFSSCLEGRVPLRSYPRMKWHRLDRLRDVFLDSYEEAAGVDIDRVLVRRFGFAIAEEYFRHRQKSRSAQWLAGKVLFNRLKGNIPG